MFTELADVVQALRSADDDERTRLLEQLEAEEVGDGITALDALLYDWPAWARPGQRMPTERRWEILFLCAGRAGGKTRTAAELTIEAVRDHDVGGYVALIAPTYSDISAIMINGESGILACSPPWFAPLWRPGGDYGGELHWPPSHGCPRGPSKLGGVIGYCFTAEKPEQIRGPQFGWYWGDEIAKWDLNGGDGLLVKSNIDFAHRLGRFKRGLYTSTPKPTPLICTLEDSDKRDRKEIAEGTRDPDDRTVILRRWSTRENEANLGAEYIERLNRQYAGTTKGREELDAEIIRDNPDAMWSHSMLEAARVEPDDVPDLVRVVVAVDNATTESKPGQIDQSTVESRNRAVGSADTGIIVVGLGADGLYYVLGDWTVNAGPDEWGRQVLSAFAAAWPGRMADAVVCEKNAGGNLIKRNLDIVMRDANVPADLVPIKYVTARDGKDARAEPVVSLYEQGRVKHAARLADLEFQQSQFRRGKSSYKKDRVDALVWGVTELISGPRESRAERAKKRGKAYTR